jgi:aminocarboxymuconate-semialdehyde decarboxylase
VIISSNIENINIGELPLDPFWQKAEELGMPVLIHPVLVGTAPRAAKFGLAQVVQYTFDTTLGVGSLLMSASTSCIGAWTVLPRETSRRRCRRPMPRR